MTNTLTISREQLEILLSGPPGEAYLAAKKELRALLAAPVVESQPVRYPTLASLLADLPEGYNKDDVAFGWNECVDNTSPPTPVAVDERAEFDAWTVRKGRVVGYSGWREDFEIWQARACLDKVKELNQ